MDISGIVRMKRVAVVGHASSIFGTAQGGDIDGHDVVVRCNLMMPPSGREADMGTRLDLWYAGHVVRLEGYRHVAKTKVYDGVPVCLKKKELLRDIYASWSPLEPDRYAHIQPPNTWSCTGVVAVFDCLLSGASSVSVYGFDFFRSADLHSGQHRHDGTNWSKRGRTLQSLDNDLLRLWLLRKDGHPVRYDNVLSTVIERERDEHPERFALWV